MTEENKIDDKKLVELNDTIKTYRAELEKARPSQEKLENLDVKLSDLEEGNQKLVADIKAQKAENEEIKKTYELLEKQVSRFKTGGEEYTEAKKSIEVFTKFVQHGESTLTPDEVKYIRTDNNTDGGYLAPTEIMKEINKKITEISPVRSVARVKNILATSATTYSRDTLVTAYWTGEGESFTESNSTYGNREIPLHSITGKVRITTKALLTSIFNFDTEIQSDLIESFALAEGTAFVDGNGVKKPTGFMQNTDIASINSGIADEITADCLIDITGELKVGYNPSWMLNRRTLADIRKLKDGTGRYIWATELSQGNPLNILGVKYVIANDMPDIGANTYPVIFGDFSKGYLIIDGTSIRFLRNPYKEDGFVHITAEKFVGGQVILPEALKKIKIAS